MDAGLDGVDYKTEKESNNSQEEVCTDVEKQNRYNTVRKHSLQCFWPLMSDASIRILNESIKCKSDLPVKHPY